VTEQLRRGMQPILVAKIVGHSSCPWPRQTPHPWPRNSPLTATT
jgi:hypothetical protein